MIEYEFKGNVDNAEILKYYSENPIDCFALLSEHEGAPVSIMEAESAGIPIVATDVGGVREMIDGNGILLPSNPSDKEASEAIISILTADEKEKRKMHRRSRELWEKKFDAEKNARSFSWQINEVMNSQRIVFITEGYPYTDDEKSFLETELKELLRHYYVTIVACVSFDISENDERIAAEKVKRLKDCDSPYEYNIQPYIRNWSIKNMFPGMLKYLLSLETKVERKDIIRSGDKLSRRLWESIKYYCEAGKFYNWFKENIEYDNSLIYTYWNLEPTLAISLNKEKLHGVKILSRVHGYDYQDEQWEKSIRKPFLKTVDDRIDKVVFVCQAGKDYYLNKVGKTDDSTKYFVGYLGSGNSMVRCSQLIFNEKKTKTSEYLLTSCSSMISLKRVDLIIGALKEVLSQYPQINIKWVHFGDGELRNQLEEMAQRCFGETKIRLDKE